MTNATIDKLIIIADMQKKRIAELEQQRDELLDGLESFHKAMEFAGNWPDTDAERRMLQKAVWKTTDILAKAKGGAQ